MNSSSRIRANLFVNVLASQKSGKILHRSAEVAMCNCSHRRYLNQSGKDDKTLMGSLGDSLTSVFKLGRSRFSDPGKVKANLPEGNFYAPKELELTYPHLVDKIHQKLSLSNR